MESVGMGLWLPEGSVCVLTHEHSVGWLRARSGLLLAYLRVTRSFNSGSHSLHLPGGLGLRSIL